MPSGKITLSDIYAINADIRDDIKELKACVEKDSSRISVLELWKAEIMAKVTLIVGLVSLGFTILWDWVRRRMN